MCEGRPVLPEGEVAKWAARFGLCAEGEELPFVKALPSYDDLNYHIRAANGEEYVMKAHNGFIPAGTAKRLLAQNRFIKKLADSKILVPKVLSTLHGEEMLPLDEPGAPEANSRAHIRVLTYLPGDIVAIATPKSDRMLQAVGALCGRMANALAGFQDEDAHWDWDWNMKNVVAACSARVRHVADPKRQELARKFIQSYGEALPREVAAALPHSVIHGDLNDTNLLWSGEEVAGVLDFGDSMYTCTVFDVGIAAGYYALGQGDPLHVFTEVLRGYLGEASLSDAEVEAFYHVAYGRVLLSACFSAEACAAEPDNEYLAHTGDPGWVLLAKLEGVPVADAVARLRRLQDEVAPAPKRLRS